MPPTPLSTSTYLSINLLSYLSIISLKPRNHHSLGSHHDIELGPDHIIFSCKSSTPRLEANLIRKVLNGNGTAPSADTGRGKSTVSFALGHPMYHPILRTIESKGRFVARFEILPFRRLG